MIRPRLLRRALVLALFVALAPAGSASAGPADLPFRNPRLSIDARVADLVGRLTLDEKISLLHQYQPAIPRLGIASFKTGTEALHGVAWSNNAKGDVVTANGTAFPQAVGLASTWDPDLVKRVGGAVGDEARAYHAQDPAVWGLNLWAPVVNLLRDPRWGRNEEGYSEDPLLTGAVSIAYTRGLRGDDPRYLKAAPTLKHYLANNNEYRRDVTSSNLPPRVLNEYDRKAFRPALAAGSATGVMSSYNLVNGRPNTVNPDLNGIVRSWSDQPLFNVTDAFAPGNLTGSEQYYATPAEADAAVLKAGLDSFTADGTNAQPTVDAVKAALAQGLLTEKDIDTAVGHALRIRFRLGEFDPNGGPYANAGSINTPAHQKLARQAADEAMVLLRNDANTLPLDPTRTRKIAVIGPLQDTLFSDWYGGNLPYKVTPLGAVKERLGAGATGVEALDRIALKDVATGHYLTATNDAVVASDTTVTSASQWDFNEWMADYATLRNAGNGKYLTGNWGPYNTSSDGPGGWFVQQQFRLEAQPDGTYLIQYVGYETNESWWWIPEHYVTVGADGSVGTGSKAAAAHFAKEVVTSGADQAVAAARDADAAVVVVGSNPFVYGRENHDRASLALGGSQQALVEAVTRANPNTVVVLEDSYPTTLRTQPRSLLWTTHAGAETGHAVADVLFGDHNPAGRLTQTWYRGEGDLPADLLTYDIIGSNQTYQYYPGPTLFPFGYGLSYTSFRYTRMQASIEHGIVNVSVDVTNTGRRAGDEVVQVYSHQRASRDKVPLKQLRAFQRVTLRPGQTKTVRFAVPVADLAHWDVTRDRWVVETSDYDLLVGASSADIRQHATVRVNGETIPHRDLSRPTRAENFDGYAGVALVDETKASGTSVAGVAPGNWAVYKDAALGRARTFTAKVAGAGSIQVRLDSPTGPLAGTLPVPDTGGVYSYTSLSTGLTGVSGTHDVYLVFDSPLRLSSFTITE